MYLGNPKGVILSHENFVTNLKSFEVTKLHSAVNQPRSLAFLPWAHVYGLTNELHALGR